MTDINTDAFAITGIIQATIVDYFITFNQAKFLKTASLFAENGSLLAPFVQPIIGQAAIAAYLSKEAQGIKLFPQQGICEPVSDLEEYLERYKVLGKVKTALFTVNVAWYFTLNQDSQIATVQIKLLASPQELLSLQSKRDRGN